MRKQNEVIVEMDKQTEKMSEEMWHEKNNFNQYVASDSRDLPGTGYLSSVRDFYGKSGNLQLRGTSARREGWLCYLAFASAVSDVANDVELLMDSPEYISGGSCPHGNLSDHMPASGDT